MSDEPAEPRGVRPGPETPAPGRFLRRPDLLERRPVVGRALGPHEPRRIRLLEPEIHLQAAVVGPAPVGPAALEAMDAEKCRLVGRVLCRLPETQDWPLPTSNGGSTSVMLISQQPSVWARDAHHLPAPVAFWRRRSGLSQTSAARCSVPICSSCCICCLCLGCAPADAATATCEQAGASQDGSPQFPTSTWSSLASRRPNGSLL